MTPKIKKPDRSQRWDKGFTLIEVMITIVVFTIAALALSRLSVGTTQSNTIARNSTATSITGATFLETVLSRAYRGQYLANGTTDSFVIDGYTVTYTITDNAVIPQTKHLAMVVSYQIGSVNRTLRYNYLLPERT